MLPHFQKGFILWQILQVYIIVCDKKVAQKAVPSVLPPHSVSHFSLKMLKYCPLFGFTLISSASWFAISQICLEGPQQG